MCCRYVLLNKHARDLLARAGVPDEDGDGAYPTDNYNIPPGVRIPAVRKRGGSRNRLECASLLWGFRAAGSGDAAPLINARAETLFEKPAFRDAARMRRCLVPASAFYEWERDGNARLPWLFRLRDERPFFLAGIWQPASGNDAGTQDTCAVITVAPNALMSPIHHRMPAIVFAENAAEWLDGGSRESLSPIQAEQMTATRVSIRMNSVRNNDASCLAPDTSPPAPRQQSFLF